MTISIKALEFRMAAVIRKGLCRSLRNADPTNITASLRIAADRLEYILYAPIHAQILQIYSEGYVSAGNLIQRPKPYNPMRSAASPLGDMVSYEDPRIAKATKAVVYGLKDSLGGYKNEIQATIRSGIERGETIPQLTLRIERYFDIDRVASTRLARTIANDIYNRAHLDRYEASGVVDGVEYSAHIDRRTSDVCRMLNGTIWGMGDSKIQVPPMHFNCRSRIKPYFGVIPGKRDFKSKFGSKFVADATKSAHNFRSKYWSPMPHTKASAAFQRSYFTKSDIKSIITGLNLAITEERTRRAVPDIIALQRLKDILRYRKIDPDKTVIADRFGKSLLLDKLEERDIMRAIKALIAQVEDKLMREIVKRKKMIDAAWKEVVSTGKGINRMEKDILYYRKQMKTYPERATEYQTLITRNKRLIATAKTQEARQIREWNSYTDMGPSPTTIMLEAEKERYQDILDGFDFQDR